MKNFHVRLGALPRVLTLLARLAPMVLMPLLALMAAAGPALAIPLDRSIAQLQHKSWTAKDGVPPSITSLAQTEDGYLWIGSVAGLFRFDGARFEEYQPKQGTLPATTVYTLKAQPGGGLWIGWQQGGLSFLKDGILVNYGKEQGLTPGTVWGFAFDRSGAVWAAGTDGLMRFERQRWQKMGPAQGFTARAASAVFVDRDGNVGAFSERGLFLRAPGASTFAPPLGTLETRAPPQQGRDGRIYFIEERGIRVIDSLARYDRLDHPWLYRNASGDSGSLLIDADGGLWFDELPGGLRRRDPADGVPVGANGRSAGTDTFSRKDGLSADLISLMLEDREGNIWVATGAGLDRFRQGDVNRVTPADPAYAVDAARLLPGPDGDMLLARSNKSSAWIALRADGAARPAPSARRPTGEVNATLRTRDGALWLSTPSGLRRIQAGAATRTIPNPPDMGPVAQIHTLAEGVDGSLWASVVGAGVFRYRAGRWERATALPAQGARPAMAMLADARGRMFFAYADNRIAMLEDGKVSVFSEAQGLTLGRITTLYASGARLWAAGQNGIALLREGRFTPWKLALPKTNNVSAMLIDKVGDMWFNTSAGTAQLPAAEVRLALADAGHAARGRLYDALDGIAGATSILHTQSLAQAGDGKIWLSTRDGTAWIDPRRLLKVPTPPAPLIESLSASGSVYREPAREAAKEAAGLSLAPESRDVKIDYTSAVLGLPERLRFRYRLDGYDRQWQEAGARRQAFYTGLPPGHYHFRVAARNEGDDWGPEGAGLDFTVLPAYYQTWWFRGLLMAALGLLIWLLCRMRLRQLALQFKMQMEVRQAERERIARELHDTLLQGTQAMIIRFHNAAGGLPAHDPARALLDRALAQADDLLTEGRERVHDLRASDCFGAGAAASIQRDGAALAAEHGLRFDWCEHGAARAILPETGHELYRIAMEAITNAVRHARAHRIEVDIRYEFLALRLSVSDDGRGLPAQVLEHGRREGHWGLPGLRERAARLRSTLLIASTPQGGTSVKLRIPARLAYAAPAPRATWFSRGAKNPLVEPTAGAGRPAGSGMATLSRRVA